MGKRVGLMVVLLAGCGDNAAQSDGGTSEGPADTDAMATSGSSDGDGSGGETDGPEPNEDAPLQQLHRLNGLEYDNTVRDLLRTSLRPSTSFGPDPEANGFDNMAAQLQISSAIIGAYDAAAHDVIDDALDDFPVFAAVFEKDDLAVPGGYAVGSLQALSGNTLSVEVTVPAYADAQIVVDLGVSVVGPAPQPTAFLRVNGVDLPGFQVEGSAAIPSTHTQPIALAAGVHTIELVPTNFINDAAANNSNNIFVASVRVQSLELGPGPGHDLVYVCDPTGAEDVACYRQILERFATRAWRRPVATEELDGLMGLWSTVLAAGESPDQALRLAMRGVMLSPKFFARMRTVEDDDHPGWLDDYVLASRLSYFIWSSMPDERLFDMAARGELSTDEGLSEAVGFMLEDPKAVALIDGFAEQWLSTRHLGTFVPSPDIFPGFDDDVRSAMVEESRAFFSTFLEEGTPVANMLQPDFAFLNDRLAEHYGLELPGSEGMVRVPAFEGDRRGLLTLGAWLTATSHADHSSPIRRGHWVTDRVMCTPTPPPPPGLVFDPPELGGDEPVRDALERHRDDPGCAVCHAFLDVVGIGFEEYDGVGVHVLDPEVDNLGELPDGRTFNGADGFAKLYTESPEFVGCMTEKLFVYAAGRGIDNKYDEPALEAITEAAVAGAYDLHALIDAIVHTPGFRSPAPLEESP